MKSEKFSRGDFVKFASDSSKRFGIVVEVHKTNFSESKHVQNVMNSYSNVYYILVDGNAVEGPFFHDELLRVN